MKYVCKDNIGVNFDGNNYEFKVGKPYEVENGKISVKGIMLPISKHVLDKFFEAEEEES